jgi:hypothetical protein
VHEWMCAGLFMVVSIYGDMLGRVWHHEMSLLGIPVDVCYGKLDRMKFILWAISKVLGGYTMPSGILRVYFQYQDPVHAFTLTVNFHVDYQYRRRCTENPNKVSLLYFNLLYLTSIEQIT